MNVAVLILHAFFQGNGLHPFRTGVIPLTEEVFSDIGVPPLKIFLAGHVPYYFQHGPPALFLDGLFHHLFHDLANIFWVAEGNLIVRGQGKECLHTPAPQLLDSLGPQGQGVGQAPYRGIAGVMLLPSAKAKVGKSQGSHGIHDLVQELLAYNDLAPFGGSVQCSHAAGQFAQGRITGNHIIGQHIRQGQVAYRAVIGKLVDNGHIGSTSFRERR